MLLCCFGCNQGAGNEADKVREFVKQWNDAHTQIQSPYLERKYMDVVNYYGKEFRRNEVQRDKNLMFQKFPDYKQSIVNDEIEVNKLNGRFLVKFTKQVNYADIKANYTSFLSITRRNGDYKILREGVDNTNENLDAPIFLNSRARETYMNQNRQLYGDFNGDGLSDFANVISPEVVYDTTIENEENNEVKCKDECNSLIVFSSKDLGDITVKNSYQSKLVNLKDINNDEADEIGYWDIKPDTKTLFIYSTRNGELLCKPVVINRKMHENLDLIDVFKRSGPNEIKISYSEKSNGKWILKSEEIKLKPMYISDDG
jgi:hypothetical protein